MKALLVIFALFLASVCVPRTSPAQDQHAARVDNRGDHAMGFLHQTAAHHFLLLRDGGTISVETRRDRDDATRDQIRAHLAHIAALFTSGDFDIPMFIHNRVPPGVPEMKTRAAAITYTYQEAKHGGQVRIKTTDPDALQAVHEFLVFQIQDHRTGDPVVTRDLPLPISQ